MQYYDKIFIMEYKITIPQKFQNITINNLLEEKWLVPRKQRHFLRTKKNILVNNQNVNWNDKVMKGDVITIKFDLEDFPQTKITYGQKEFVDILFEDEHIIIVNKPEGMKTHPNNPNEIALLNHVSAYLNHPAYVVHRLDKETSGAILFAKNQFILPILSQMLEKRQIHRTYQALSQGNFNKTSFTVNKPIGRDRHDKKKQIVSSSGKKAITNVKIIKNFSQVSLIECRLETGRTHQIRVHLAYESHPLIGDKVYGKLKANRLMLHSKELSFTHPLTEQKIQIFAPSKTFDDTLQIFS